MIRFPIFLLLMFGLVACQEKSKTTTSASLTNEELLQLMQGELFEVQIPEDVTPEDSGGLAFRSADGTIDALGGSTPWTPGEVVKIVCFAPDKDGFSYAWFGKAGFGRGSTRDFPETQTSSPNNKRSGLAVGERLVRYSRDGKIVLTGEPGEDDFDVIFHIQKKAAGK